MADDRTPEPHHLRPDEDAAVDRFDRYLDALLTGGRPSPEDVADANEAEMARTAAELSAAVAGAEDLDPDPAFVEQLRLRMRQADQGIASVQVPLPMRAAGPAGAAAEPDPNPGRLRLSRRQVLRAGLTGAAGIAAGALGASVLGLGRKPASDGTIWADAGLVSGPGFWSPVAQLDDVPPGSAVRFSTAAFDGYVVNDGGEIRALSSVCTHMGCTLHYRPDWKDLRCPCHGASFDLQGRLANGKSSWRQNGGYRGDARAYPVALPPLVRPKVKVEDGQVMVWTAQV